MSARLMLLLGGTMAIAAFALGCGGSDGGDSSEASTTVTSSSLSKAAFAKKANTICEKGRERIIGYPSASLSKSIELGYVPAYQGIVEEIQALGAPKGGEAEVEAFLSAMQSDAAALEENKASITAFSETEPYFKSSAAAARKAGLARCTFYANFSSGKS